MKVDIYRSKSNQDNFLTLPAGNAPAALDLPMDVIGACVLPEMFMRNVEMKADEPRAGMNSHQILQDLQQQGYAVHSATVTVTQVRRHLM